MWLKNVEDDGQVNDWEQEYDNKYDDLVDIYAGKRLLPRSKDYLDRLISGATDEDKMEFENYETRHQELEAQGRTGGT